MEIYKAKPDFDFEVELRSSGSDAPWTALWDWLLAPEDHGDIGIAGEGVSFMATGSGSSVMGLPLISRRLAQSSPCEAS